MVASYKNIDKKATKFRGLEPTNPQGKTSKQLADITKVRGKNPI